MMNTKLSKEFDNVLRQYLEYLSDDDKRTQWDKVVSNFWLFSSCNLKQDLSSEFLDEYKDQLNWNLVSLSKRKFKRRELQRFRKKLNWRYLSCFQRLSVAAQQEHADKLDWGILREMESINSYPRINRRICMGVLFDPTNSEEMRNNIIDGNNIFTIRISEDDSADLEIPHHSGSVDSTAIEDGTICDQVTIEIDPDFLKEVYCE